MLTFLGGKEENKTQLNTVNPGANAEHCNDHVTLESEGTIHVFVLRYFDAQVGVSRLWEHKDIKITH